MKELVAVIGCHRSGTSCVAGGLKCLGVHAGPPSQLMRPSPDNPLGYFESLPVVGVHDRLLRRYGGSWDAPPAPTEARPMRDAADQLVKVLHGFDDAANVWMVKDPRMTLFPLVWEEVARRMERALRVVHAVRRPEAVVKSLCRRDGMEPERAEWLRSRYEAHAAAWMQRANMMGAAVPYEAVLMRPEYLWEVARDHVDGLRFIDAKRLRTLRAFVDKGLNHG